MGSGIQQANISWIPLHWAKTTLMLQALTTGMVSILTFGRTRKLIPPPWGWMEFLICCSISKRLYL